jgi:hypothetical protein
MARSRYRDYTMAMDSHLESSARQLREFDDIAFARSPRQLHSRWVVSLRSEFNRAAAGPVVLNTSSTLSASSALTASSTQQTLMIEGVTSRRGLQT